MQDDGLQTAHEIAATPIDSEAKRIELLKMSQAVNLLGSWEWDLRTNILLWTDAAFQLKAAPVTVDHLISFEDTFGNIHPEDRDMVREKFNSLQQKQDVEFEYRVIKDDQTRIIWAWAGMVKDDEGEPQYLRGTSQDITKQREAEKKLRLMNEAFQQTEQVANLGNWQLNLKTNKYTYSGNLYKIYGVGVEEFEPSYANFLRFVHPDDTDKISSEDDLINLSETPLSKEFRIIRPDGQTRNVKSIVKIFTNFYGDNIVLGTTQDITDEVKLRNQLQEKVSLNEMIIENSVDYVSAYDNKLRITAWNRKCEEKTGFKKEDVMGKHVLEVFSGDGGEAFLADLDKALKGEVIHREEKNVANDEFYDFFILPLSNPNGNIFGVVCVSHDLTAIKHVTDKLVELNQSLKLKNEELERSNNELASFSYVASHDLQEPLRKIQTFSSRIIEKEFESLSSHGLEYFRRMESAAKRMQTLIDDLLTFSRTNTQPKDFKQVDLNEMLKDIRAEFKETIDEKKAVIEMDKLPVANVIGFQFRQLLANLLQNALKYNKPGTPPHVKITCEVVDGADVAIEKDNHPREYYRINFKDNGIGFDRQYNRRIFELFQRLHGKSEYPGTGLGLAICKKVMVNHDGFITADAEIDKGATFSVYLPI
jgi:PAS domain S-box-containing protein